MGVVPVSQPGQQMGVSIAAGGVDEVVAEVVGQVPYEGPLHPLQRLALENQKICTLQEIVAQNIKGDNCST
jgi:hypothetical protein